jgi:putative inorganic carbon (HCO3(-)) transporter
VVRPVLHRLALACVACWLIYLLIAPTAGFSWIDSWHNEQRAVQLALLAASTLVASALLVSGLIAVSPWLLGVVLVGCVSSALSPAPAAGLAEVGLFTMLGLAAAVAAAVARQHHTAVDRWLPVVALLIGAAHVSGIAVRVLAAYSVQAAPEFGIFLLGYSNPRFASALYVMLIPLIAVLGCARSQRTALRVLAMIVVAGLWTANIGLGTRGVWLATGLALPLGIICLGKRQALRLAAVIAAGAAVGWLTYLGIAALLTFGSTAAGGLASAVPEGLQNTTLTAREVLWVQAFNAWLSHPLLGLGPMQLAANATYVGAHPHNWLLQLLAEWGAVGAALLLMWLYRTARATAISAQAGPGNATSAAVWLALACALALGLVDGNLVMPVSQSAFALLFGVALGNAPSKQQRWKWRPLVAAGSIALSIHSLSFATTTYAGQAAETAEFRKRHADAWLTPRLWESGTLFLTGAN